MARSKGLFTGGIHSATSKAATESKRTEPKKHKHDNTVEALQKRREPRHELPVVELKGSITGSDRGRVVELQLDFTPLAIKYPHHEQLISGLWTGALAISKNRSVHTIKTAIHGIHEFVTFLNSERNLSNNAVATIANINVTVGRAFSNYLLSLFPRRSVNRKRYRAVGRCIRWLQHHYSAIPEIGARIQWPTGPGKSEKPRQGYTPEAFRELFNACQKDIETTRSLHSLHREAVKSGDVLLLEEWNPPNLMHYLHGRLTNLRDRTPRETIGLIFKCSPNARRFLQREGHTLDTILDVYQTKGDALAAQGQLPNTARDSWTLINVMHWIKKRWEEKCFRSEREIVKRSASSTEGFRDFLKANNYSVEDVLAIYHERGNELAQAGRDPFGHSFYNQADKDTKAKYFKLVLSTLRHSFPRYPFDMDFNEARQFLTVEKFSQMSVSEKHSLEGRLTFALLCARWSPLETIAGKALVISCMHFLAETLYPFLLHVLLNTGWNLETALAITDDVDSHVAPDLLDPENYLVILSVKNRGSRAEATPIAHRCTKTNQYSTYRLLQYVATTIRQYRGSRNYISGVLWQYAVRPHACTYHVLRDFWSNPFAVNAAGEAFIRRHTFVHFSGRSIDHGKLRSAYETIRELQGLSIEAISMDLDHSNIDTTAEHYADDEASNAIKDKNIAGLQTKWVKTMRNYTCELAQSASLRELREAIRTGNSMSKMQKTVAKAAAALHTTEAVIIHLLSPEGQTYIASCKDSLNPTWQGHKTYLKQGQRCAYFNQCALCKQCVIFAEALPYVAKRLLDLEAMRQEMNSYQWLGSFGGEYDAWSQILEDWRDREQVAMATACAKRGDVVLPTRLRGPAL